MQVSVSTTGSLERRVEVAVPATEVDREVEQRLKKISRTARLKGFRPGKAPFAVIRQQFGQQVHAEVVNDLMRSSFAQVLDQQKLKPAGGSRLEPIAMQPGADLKFAAVFEVMPEVRVNPPDTLEIQRPVSSVLESDVDAMIESMRSQRTVYTAVERPAHDTDRVTIDFDGTVEGEPFEDGNRQDVQIILGAHQTMPEIEEALKGAVAGDKRSVSLTFPAEHPNKALAGRPAQLEVLTKTVEEASLPAVDAEFCRAYGVEDGTTESLRMEVRKSMEGELAELIRKRVRSQVLDALYQQNPIDVPRALVEEQVQHMQVDMGRRMGIKDADRLPPRGPFEEPARRRVALGLILAQIVQTEGFKPDREGVMARVNTAAAAYSDPEQARRMFLQSPEAMRQIESGVMEEQAIEWVIERARVTERALSFSDLTGFGREDSPNSEIPT